MLSFYFNSINYPYKPIIVFPCVQVHLHSSEWIVFHKSRRFFLFVVSPSGRSHVGQWDGTIGERPTTPQSPKWWKRPQRTDAPNEQLLRSATEQISSGRCPFQVQLTTLSDRDSPVFIFASYCVSVCLSVCFVWAHMLFCRAGKYNVTIRSHIVTIQSGGNVIDNFIK